MQVDGLGLGEKAMYFGGGKEGIDEEKSQKDIWIIKLCQSLYTVLTSSVVSSIYPNELSWTWTPRARLFGPSVSRQGSEVMNSQPSGTK